jgi:hypothetical protein
MRESVQSCTVRQKAFAWPAGCVEVSQPDLTEIERLPDRSSSINPSSRQYTKPENYIKKKSRETLSLMGGTVPTWFSVVQAGGGDRREAGARIAPLQRGALR